MIQALRIYKSNNNHNWKVKVKVKVAQSRLTLCDPMVYTVLGFSRQEYWSGLLFPSPGDLPNPGSNTGLPHCRWILYQLNPKGSPKILEWVNYPFFPPRGSSQARNQTRISCIAARLFTNWDIRENHNWKRGMKTEYRNQLSRKQIHDQENQQSPLVILFKRTLTPIIF